MASTLSFANGLSIQANTLASSPILQGGDTFNFTVHLTYTSSQENFSWNSTACKTLPEKILHVKGLIILPIFLQFIFSVNKSITSDLTNCSVSPRMDISNNTTNSHSIVGYINTSDISWTAQFDFNVDVTEQVPPDSWFNITGEFTVDTQSKHLVLARYQTRPIVDFVVVPMRTSFAETPGYELTTEEAVSYSVSLKIPSVTTELTVTITLPVLGGKTPMGYSNAAISLIDSGVTSLKLSRGSQGEFLADNLYRTSFPSSLNVAKFDFGRTVNTKQGYQSVGFKVTAKILDDKMFFPGSGGNISFEVSYQTIDGVRHIGPIYQYLNVSEPLLLYTLELKNYQPSMKYQGNDVLTYTFMITNPKSSTKPVEDLKAEFMLPGYVNVVSSSLKQCNEFNFCTHLAQSNSSSINVTLSSLNVSFALHGSLTIALRPSVKVNSSLTFKLLLTYRRPSWLTPVVRTAVDTIFIRDVSFSGPHNFSSSVTSADDNTVITPGEDVSFQFKMKLPVSRSSGFTVVFRSEEAAVVSVDIVNVGANIELDGEQQIQGMALNITLSKVDGLPFSVSQPIAVGNFTGLANNGISQLPGSGDMLFKATVCALDASGLSGKQFVSVSIEAYVDNRPQPRKFDFKLKIIKPELQVTSTVTPNKNVNYNDELSFSVNLAHTPLSTSHAYRVLLEIAISTEFLSLNYGSIQPAGVVQVVTGNQAPSGSSRYSNSGFNVLVYQSDVFPLSNTITLSYKASTTTKIPSSVYVRSPLQLTYTILPKTLAPRTGWLYNNEMFGAQFLTFRPTPYVQVLYTSTPRVIDAGDKVEFNLTVMNTGFAGDTHIAYDLQVDLTYQFLDTVSMQCDTVSSMLTPANTTGSISAVDLSHGQAFYCNITGYVTAHVSPGQDISPLVRYTYFSLSKPRPPGTISYNFKITAHTLVASINTTVTASPNAQTLMAGKDLDFSLRLGIPECVTQLALTITMPVVQLAGTKFERQRRSVVTQEEMAKPRRSDRVRRSGANLVYVLEPLTNESSISTDVNSTLIITHPSPNITRLNSNTLQINFGSVQNPPSPLRSVQGVVIYLKFRSAFLPLVLSGRSLVVVVSVNFTGGMSNVLGRFNIIGPLLKPLLTITKSVQAFDQERDSPLFQYNVTVTHSEGSKYDAHDIIIKDSTKNMNIQRSSVIPRTNVIVTYPVVNVYTITLDVAKLAVGESVSLLYTASFIIKAKDESIINEPVSMTWRSIQLNSLVYDMRSNLTACVRRLDTTRWKTKHVTGFFALGILLGLLIGFIVAVVVILLIIKCCDKGKIASCYSCFTNKTSMTVLTGGSQYIFSGDDDAPANKLVARHNETCMVKTDESIVPVLSLDDVTQTEKELDSLDLQATVNLDAQLEIQRHDMFVHALSLLVKKLRVKREVSSSDEKSFLSRLKAELGGIALKMSAEFKRKSQEITDTIQKETRRVMKIQAKRQAKEREETENKIKGLVSARERNDIMDMLRRRHAKEDQEIKRKAKLDLDVEMEKLRKELTVNKRFASKEIQSKLLQDLIKEARLNEDQASALVREHLLNMSAVDKAMDEERSRRVVALEMRLAERRALALQKLHDERHNQVTLKAVMEHQDESLEDLVSSSKLSEADAALYRERYKKETEALDKKLQKERQKQEKNLHKKLTALKQKRVEDLNRQHQEQMRNLSEEENDKFEQVNIDCIAALQQRQRLIQSQRRELEGLETKTDKEAAEELEKLQDQKSRDSQEQAKTSIQKICRDMTSKGLDEAETNAIIDKHFTELTRQQEAKDEQKQRNAQHLEKRLEKLRKALEKKAKEEMRDQEEVRKKEEQIVSDLIVSQVVMSEAERDRILAEHEKNLAELESSLTLNKLKQRQKLEEKLAEKRKRKLEELERKQHKEEQVKDYGDKILAQGEDIELLKKHEQQKIELLKEDNYDEVDYDTNQVREEMMKERAKKLEEHQENLSATIARLQIEKAKQISQMAIQQSMLNQLQTNLVDELESQGAFEDPETKEIVDKYKKDAKKVEENLKNQRKKQEEDLKERLQQKLQQREQSMLLESKTKYSRYVDDGSNKAVLRFQKAAIKARHMEEIEEMKKRMGTQIEQSLNELRMNQDLQRMRAVEERNLKFISALVDKGKLKEGELESVLKFLFPSKSPEYIDSLLSKIFGTDHPKRHSLLTTGEMSQLEKRVRRASVKPLQFIRSTKSKKKNNKYKSQDQEDTENALPPVIIRGGGRKTLLHDDEPESKPPQSLLGSLSPRSFNPGNESSEDNRLLDQMFGDSAEVEFKKAGKRRKKQDDR